MPELPEVETVRRGLHRAMAGERIRAVTLRRPDLRFPFPEDFAARLAGRAVVAVGRRAKYLMIDLDDGALLAAHLGMTGSFRVARGGAGESAGEAVPGAYYHARGSASAHDHVEIAFESGLRVTYNDPRRFGFMALMPRAAAEDHPLFRGIGVEPLGQDFDSAVLARLLHGRTAPLKAALLDQRLIAGLGNIYVCEALHRAGLSPRREAGSIVRRDGNAGTRTTRLAATIRAVLAEAVAAGGSTLRDYRHADGSLGTFQHGFRAYDREGEPCMAPGCRGTIARIVQTVRPLDLLLRHMPAVNTHCERPAANL